jgi:hypothetical protein
VIAFPVDDLAALFGTQITIAPYSPDGSAVYELRFRPPGQEEVHLILWPSLGRVDVRSGPHSWVMKGVVTTEIIAGVEVIFRPADDAGYLFVATTGMISMVA